VLAIGALVFNVANCGLTKPGRSYAQRYSQKDPVDRPGGEADDTVQFTTQ
jgi:hypothetical protein